MMNHARPVRSYVAMLIAILTLAGCGSGQTAPGPHPRPARIIPAARVTGAQVRSIDGTVRGFNQVVTSGQGNPAAYLAPSYPGGRTIPALQHTLGVVQGERGITFAIQSTNPRGAVVDVTYGSPKSRRDRLELVNVRGSYRVAAITPLGK